MPPSGEDRYRRAIRGAVRGYWSGVIDYGQFFDMMLTTTRAGVTDAYHAGARDCGILPSELTPLERGALEYNIRFENQWIQGLAEAIDAGSKANGGKLTPLFNRADIWIGRWVGIRSEARAAACADQKLEWVQGATEQGCPSCSKLSGKVKRASWWYENGILPRVHASSKLACGGWHCDCELVPTDKPCSPGSMPSLP